MSTPTKLIAFLVGLAAVFAGSVGAGVLVPQVMGSGTPDAGAHEGGHTTGTTSADDNESRPPGGLMIAEHGYTLALSENELPAGDAIRLGFSIIGPDGEPVTDYTESHDKDLHLIVVRRDMTGFQHVHPTLDAEGAWSVPVNLEPGQWRVFADFTPGGEDENLTLGADLAVAGDYRPRQLPAAASSAEVDDYTVHLDGALVPGKESKLILTVTRAGEPVTDLQPYLAAYGHLVALRDGDLAYLHVHPAGTPGDGTTKAGPGITFYATAPSGGDYRLFLDFRNRGTVRTAEFTANAGQLAESDNDKEQEAAHDH